MTQKKHEFKIVREAPVGSLVPILRTEKIKLNPLEYFAVLSDYGRRQNCGLLESAEIVQKYGEQSMGFADPCLWYMTGIDFLLFKNGKQHSGI